MDSLSFKHNPQMIVYAADSKFGHIGYVVIDRVPVGNPIAIGGVRMRKGLTLEEIVDLSREMTLKFAFLNIPVGGAKAGVLWKPLSSPEERKEYFTAFGRSISPLLKKGLYCAGEDLGVNSVDIYHIKKGAGVKTHIPSTSKGISGYYTGLSVYICTEQLLNSLGMEIKGARVAIEGFGKVGTSAARLFYNAGAKVVAVSTVKGGIYNPQGLDIDKIVAIAEARGDDVVKEYTEAEQISSDGLLDIDIDVLAPCAGPYSITKENLHRLKAKMVVPGANIPVTSEAELLLYERGIHCMPAFVSSCGGILAYALIEHGFHGVELDSIMREGFGKRVCRLIEKAQKESLSLLQAARETAERSIANNYMIDDNRQKSNRKDLLWRLYKKSRRARAGFLLKSFATSYMTEELLKDSPGWTKL